MVGVAQRHAASLVASTAGEPSRAVRHPITAQASSAVIRRGMTGAAVRELQRKLHAVGYLSTADLATGPGVFGPRTERAVMAFQSDHGLKRSGVVGSYTQAALTRATETIFEPRKAAPRF